MLLSLSVNNVTLVEHLHIDLHAGMTAITGETGAGKSLVLDALAMALGDRGDTGRIRHNKNKLDVSALFDVSHNAQAQQWLQHQDIDERNECLLRRTLNTDGRSRGFINGQPATMQQLQQLGEMMIDIHSQHAHQSLLLKESHQGLLDAFAGCSALADNVKQLFGQWQRTQQQIAHLQNHSQEHNARRELLDFQLCELTDLAIADGELRQLEREQQLLANGEHIIHDSQKILELCQEAEQGNALGLLQKALHLLQALPEKTEQLNEAQSLFDSAIIQVDEACREIQQHIDGFNISPQRLEEVEERLSAIYQIARKHRLQAEQLPALHQQLQQEMDELLATENGEQSIEGLTATLAKRYKQLAKKSAELGKIRQAAAPKFALKVNQQLASLAMASASFNVQLKTESTPKNHGYEAVEFVISTNPGSPHKALNRIASGGELSRISLAIQVIAAQHSQIPTLVFDEVDVGVGGAVAEVVGKLLRQLGSQGQIICVTHLPQVASCAHQHLIASKTSNGTSTESALTQLHEQDRNQEIARMLGGATITAQTIAHAKEMLETSAGIKNAIA